MEQLPRFDRVLHFRGSNATPDDVVMSAEAEAEVLRAEVVVCEKLDGINVSIGRVAKERLAFALRDPWTGSLGGTIERAVDIWIRQRYVELMALLAPGEVLYGEWLWHRISIAYRALPDSLIGFALRRRDGRFEPFDRFVGRTRAVGLTIQVPLWRGRLQSGARLRRLCGPSQFAAAPVEGLVVERTRPGKALRFSKWVQPGYRKVHAGEISGEKNDVLETGP